MRNILPFLFLLFATSIYGKDPNLPRDTNKYRINLPDHWKPGNKVWQILNDKLPLVCTELKDKDLCGDNCKPIYTVDFEMTDPTVLDYYPKRIANNKYEIITLYSFQSNLYIRNRKGEIVTRIIIVDTNEVFNVKHPAIINEFAEASVPKRMYIKKVSAIQTEAVLQEVGQQPSNSGYSNNRTAADTPYSYINKNKEKLVPRTKDLYEVIDRKFRALDDD